MTSPKSTALLVQLSPLSLVRMAWKQKIPLLLIWLLGTAVAIVVAWKLPAQYRAETVILVDSQKIPDRYVTATVSSDVGDRLATLSQQILSATRLKKIIDDYNLYAEQRKTMAPEEIIDLMRKDITIRLEKGWSRGQPGAFRISYEGPDPNVVAEIANRLASLYIEENLRVRELQAEGTTDFIESQLKEAKQRLDDMEAAVSRYKIQHNGDLPEQENSLNGALARLQIELQGNQDAANRAQQNKLLLENSLNIAETELASLIRAASPPAKTDESEEASDTASPSVPKPPKPLKKSDILQAQLELLRVRYSDDHPDIKRLREEIARLKVIEKRDKDKPEMVLAQAAGKPALAKMVDNSAIELANAISRAKERIQGLKTQLMLAGRELDTRNAERQRILKQIADYQGRVSQMPIREQEMAALTRDYEMSKANYRSLLDKKMSAEMAADLERRQKSERFTVLDPAQPPQKPFKPMRPAIAGMGSMLGLALAILAALGREFRKGVLLGEWELPGDVAILSRIPMIEIDWSRAHTDDSTDGAAKARSRRLRLAMISSAVLSLLAVLVAGAYFWKRF